MHICDRRNLYNIIVTKKDSKSNRNIEFYDLSDKTIDTLLFFCFMSLKDKMFAALY